MLGERNKHTHTHRRRNEVLIQMMLDNFNYYSSSKKKILTIINRFQLGTPYKNVFFFFFFLVIHEITFPCMNHFLILHVKIKDVERQGESRHKRRYVVWVDGLRPQHKIRSNKILLIENCCFTLNFK